MRRKKIFGILCLEVLLLSACSTSNNLESEIPKQSENKVWACEGKSGNIKRDIRIEYSEDNKNFLKLILIEHFNELYDESQKKQIIDNLDKRIPGVFYDYNWKVNTTGRGTDLEISIDDIDIINEYIYGNPLINPNTIDIMNLILASGDADKCNNHIVTNDVKKEAYEKIKSKLRQNADNYKENKEKSNSSNNKKENKKSESNVDNIRPEFQKMMDEYVKFYELYKEQMNNISGDPYSILDLANLMNQYTEMTKSFELVDDNELTEEEMNLYLKTQAKILDILSEIKY